MLFAGWSTFKRLLQPGRHGLGRRRSRVGQRELGVDLLLVGSSQLQTSRDD